MDFEITDKVESKDRDAVHEELRGTGIGSSLPLL